MLDKKRGSTHQNLFGSGRFVNPDTPTRNLHNLANNPFADMSPTNKTGSVSPRGSRKYSASTARTKRDEDRLSKLSGAAGIKR